jgi:hypothetical protein
VWTKLGRRAAIFLMLAALAFGVSTRAEAQAMINLDSLNKHMHEAFDAGRISEALGIAEKFANAVEKIETDRGRAGPLTAEALGGVAWFALFAKEPQKALTASEQAMALAPDKVWLGTNRAHALLFLGRTEEAMAAYTRHKGEYVGSQGKWENAVRADFADFRKHGLDDPRLAQVEKVLEEEPRHP